MGIILDELEQDLSKILCVKDKTGRTALAIGLGATLFFEDQSTRRMREEVADVADDYIRLVREHLRWIRHPNTVRPCPMDSGHVKFPKDWLPDHPDDKSWEFKIHGGETPDAASAYHIAAFGTFDATGEDLGYLHISLPLLWFADHPGTFPEIVLNICRRLHPLSGYGGIFILESPDKYSAEEYQAVVRVIAERFPGLEVENRTAHVLWLRTGIKGINWLTVLGERWVQEVGGLPALSARLDESFGFYPYEGGLIIQAGPKPQIGDAKANRWPQHYVALARALKKIQIKDHRPFHFAGPGKMDREASLAWLFRFDGK